MPLPWVFVPTPRRSYADVAVVGGGPAGSAAATHLARAGCRVLLVDRATFPRDKCCGDGLTTGALRRLDALGLDPPDVASWQRVDGVVVRSTSGRTVRFPLPAGQGTFAAVARRADLDAALLDIARDAGADVRDGHAVTGAHQDVDGVTLDVDGLGEVRARYAVGADGAWSPLRQALAPARDDAASYRGEWHAWRQYLGGVEARDLMVWFEPDLLPGYAWSFPLPDGGANVGFGVARGHGPPTGAMRELWADLLTRPHIADALGPRARTEGTARAWPIPAAVGAADLALGRVLFIGDAARACDVLTGEGIGQALQTAELAAAALVAAGPFGPAEARRRYDAAVTRELAPDHRMSHLLHRALRRDAGCRGAVRLAGSSDFTRRHFVRWLFEDYPRGIAFTPRRWRKGAVSGAGAWA